MSLNTLIYYWRECFSSIGRNKWLSIASIGTVAVSMLIVGVFALIFLNANAAIQGIESGLEVRVFLKDDLSKDGIKSIRSEIEKLPEVALVDYISKEQALEEMKENFGDRKDILEGLQNDNPLPNAFRIKALQADQIPALAGRIERMDGVDQVIYGQGYVERIISATSWLRLAGVIVLGILCLSAVFLISTTIRMSAFARRREIGIMILLGATNWFVRFPYLLEGMILGLLGAILAGGLVYGGYLSLVSWVVQMLPFVQPITNQQLILGVIGGMLVFGLLIGSLGSIFSIRKFLKI